MSTFYSFNNKEINAVVESISEATDDVQTMATESDFSLIDGGELQMLAECIEVRIVDGKICFDLPLGIGKKCIKLPIRFPDSTVAKACLRICSRWGIPTGVEVSVSIKGETIVRKVFGFC